MTQAGQPAADPITDAGPAAGQALVVAGPGDVRLVRRAAPAAGPAELVVEPDLVGLCGTDLEIIDGQIDPAYLRYPVALGHEWTGIVAGTSPLAGRRVVVEGIIGCGHCAGCGAGLTNLCDTAGAPDRASGRGRRRRADRASGGGLPGAGQGWRLAWLPGTGDRRRHHRAAGRHVAAALVAG
jgi:threonine dehydrogenase-like Zn-dependent dehydrogenase